ncbi:hypothetical protein GCM10023074_10090 [Microbispora amethystogenes]|uniref:Uncharacterized protein n=1 Tax=Microbispora amethystogenes TaxID=1427754 RepID=A0ABQ4FIF5_9ACTN|nr:hypothetical protein Mam01_47730 [Microbispora amethystogenes]
MAEILAEQEAARLGLPPQPSEFTTPAQPTGPSASPACPGRPVPPLVAEEAARAALTLAGVLRTGGVAAAGRWRTPSSPPARGRRPGR